MADEKQAEQLPRKPTLFDGPRTATWKVDNETFRRLNRTGEFTPETEKPEAA